MIISEQWLRDWVSLDLPAQEIADCLTAAGLEVDGVQPLSGLIDKLVVGRVLQVEKHPDADRLNLTSVDIGDEQLSIVCGAANVREDMLVAVATVGAKLPNGLKIKKAKVRGIESNGMLCSAAELGLEENSAGIMELDEDALIGQRVDDYLQLDDHLIDIDLTPNRGDCLSVQGVARELNVLANGDYHPLDIADSEATIADSIDIELQDAIACPRYLGRVVKGINPDANTPVWMQERLRRSGVRPISPVVDITNYVMLELGQPMHAFDLDKLNDRIIVRQASQGETIKLLDGLDAVLDGNTLVIADSLGPIAIAGVMGGADSAIDTQTRDIVLEAAHFTRKAAAGSARRYGLHTESSHRFERGVDPQSPQLAMQRATELLLGICGGEAGPVVEKVNTEGLQQKPSVNLRLLRLQQLLGMQIEADEVAEILRRISDAVNASDDGWSVSPPSYRFDIECEADLVEEVARVKGYDAIPTAIPHIAPRSIAASEDKVNLRQLRQTLVARDFNEVITYSFIDPRDHQRFTDESPVVLNNPLAENMSVMRTTLLPGLLNALRFNSNRQRNRIRLFEIGATYHLAESKLPKANAGTTTPAQDSLAGFAEVQRLAGIVMGPLQPAQWGIEQPADVDFFDLKADMEAVLSLTGQKEAFIFKEFENISMHPGQVSKVSFINSTHGGDNVDELKYEDLGFIGRLHPGLQKQYGLPSNVFVFELDLDKALNAKLPAYQKVSRFPGIKRDLSVVVDQKLAVASLLDPVKVSLGAALVNATVFDVYSGDGVTDGRKSISFSLHLQHQDRTMTDDEAESLVQKALSSLAEEFGAELRS